MTPHIKARKEDVASLVLMPGDPLRAKYIADTFLENAVCVNEVRGMLAYTGTYKGNRITVMGSGMGMPSIGIYSFELFKFYDVESIVRIGSCGAYTEELKLYDVLLSTGSWSESSYAKTQGGYSKNITYPSKELNDKIRQTAKSLNIPITETLIHSSDVFYRENFEEYKDIYKETGAAAVEMESFALFHNANALGKKAACLLTVSDNLVTREETSADERQTAFTKMMEIALNLSAI
jgi:purine-nucleoside phosphorylase